MNEVGRNEKMDYEMPAITTLATADVIEALGPAQGMASGVEGGPPGFGPTPGITSSTGANTNRRYGR